VPEPAGVAGVGGPPLVFWALAAVGEVTAISVLTVEEVRKNRRKKREMKLNWRKPPYLSGEGLRNEYSGGDLRLCTV
jgi:hypothetical protein